MRAEFDVAVVGAGFGGSLAAMIARRLGKSVILLERGRHPRFAIGESSTPLANLLLEEIATRYELPRLLPFCKWGTWQRHYPKVACGLKRGFTFYHHAFGKRWQPHLDRANELLVAASPHDAIADTHWYRADFDQFLVEEAQRIGVEYRDQVRLSSFYGGRISGEGIDIRAKMVIDATGPRGFLSHALNLRGQRLAAMPETDALFAHFTGVRRWHSEGAPPYPVDDAAVHHVFPGGWIWILRFNNGVTSAGVVATREVSTRYGFSEGAKAWARLLRDLPSVGELFADAVPVTHFHVSRDLAWRSARAAGEGWALLPSAAGFVDPLLSTGFPLTLLGIARIGEALDRREYEQQTFADFDVAASLVGRLYGDMANFSEFVDTAMLYFAAASFSEAARRLGKPELPPGFLSMLHPIKDAKASEELIAPFNIAGLFNRKARNWYPARGEDILDNCDKLGVARERVAAMLRSSGFYASEAASRI